MDKQLIELVHQNVTVGEFEEDVDILSMDADLIDDFLEKQKDIRKTTKKVEINLVAKILSHSDDYKFIKLGLVPESHFQLGGMNIDINSSRIQPQMQNRKGEFVHHQILFIALFQGF